MTDTRMPAAQRRERIEEAAATLFAEKGYEATTVEDIVGAAGVTKPMLYRHFESKKELHLKLLELHRDRLAAAGLEPFLKGEGDPLDRLPAMAEAWFAHVQSNPYTWRLLFSDTTADPDVRTLHAELRRRQRAADVALLREFKPDLPEEELEPLGEIIRSSLAGLAVWWLDNQETPRAVMVAAVLRLTYGLIGFAPRGSATGLHPSLGSEQAVERPGATSPSPGHRSL